MLFLNILASWIFLLQSQNSPRLDGKIDENEWKTAKEYTINEDCKVLMRIENETLYAALVSKKKIWTHVYLSDGQTAHVMHASAALDAISYKKEQSLWQTKEAFDYGFRERVYDDAVQAKMDAYYLANGWVANNNNMGDGKTIEIKINISQKGPLYFACVLADFDVKLSYFPTTLTDDTILPKLVQGYAPESVKFEPTKWFKIKE